jgi:hypothetical protein
MKKLKSRHIILSLTTKFDRQLRTYEIPKEINDQTRQELLEKP